MASKNYHKEHDNYKQAIKSTSLFGGVQGITLLLSIIRIKLVAIILGTSGIGAISLYTSTINLISSFASLGIGTSSIRNIAASNKTPKLEETINSTRKLSFIFAILGTILCICIAPLLSKWSFGSNKYSSSFIFLSPVVGFTIILAGELAILKGMRKLRLVASTSILGAIATLCISIPFYFLWGLTGIIPSLVLTSLVTLIITGYHSNKIIPFNIPSQYKKINNTDYDIIKLGLSLTLANVLIPLMEYLVRAFILQIADMEMVGLYSAGYTITIMYTSMIFTAMATDYFPRLSAINKDTQAMILMINQQIEIAILLIVPLLIILLTFLSPIISLLYSSDFLSIISMVQFASVGMFIKAFSWPIGYAMLAKGDSKVYIIKEIISAIIFLSLTFGGYYYWGLTGAGIAFSFSAIYDLIQIYIITNIRFKFLFNKNMFYTLIYVLPFYLIAFYCIFIEQNIWYWCISFINIIACSLIALSILNKKTSIIKKIEEVVNKFRYKKDI